MRQQKRAVLKKYKSNSLYYKFYFLPLVIVLLTASYSIYLGVKAFKIISYAMFAGQQYIYSPMSSFYRKYRPYLQAKLKFAALINSK